MTLRQDGGDLAGEWEVEMADEKFFYCIKHQAVEGADGCRAIDRLGPYDTREEAERALDIAQARNEAWDNDPDWNDPEWDDPQPGRDAGEES